MTILMVPDDKQPWPTLGPQACDWIEDNLVFGPGDLRGEPAVLDAEKRALIWRMYEVYPQDHPQAGRRRFKRVGLSLAKGLAKTELAAWIAAAELHHDAPVRCVGWDDDGNPIGGPVTDPYIPLVAYTEEQSDELAYGALKAILEESPIAGDFDIGLERIMRRQGDGKAVSLASSPNSRDGARTTFQVCDETHWWTLPRLHQAHQTMLANIPKRKIADAWTLEVTTAYEPGSGSIAESTMEYARQVDDGKIKDSRLFFFHRQASDDVDIESESAVRAAVVDASGPAASWRDIDSIVEMWRDPTTDLSFFQRVWLNLLVKGTRRAFDVDRWNALGVNESPVKDGDLITLGFDGAQFKDATGLVATHVATGYQWVVGLWESPTDPKRDWKVPADEVDGAVMDAFERYQVWRMYADPFLWDTYLAKWSGQFGEVVVEWRTNRRRQMAHALSGFVTAIAEGEISHSGDEDLSRHIGNAHKLEINDKDDDGIPLWLIQKERSGSPFKIDLAMAAVLSWQARRDAVASGVLLVSEASVYEERGLVRL